MLEKQTTNSFNIQVSFITNPMLHIPESYQVTKFQQSDCGPVVAVWESGYSMESSVICLSLCRVDQKNDRFTTAKFTAPEKNNQSKMTDDRVTTGDYEFFDTDISRRLVFLEVLKVTIIFFTVLSFFNQKLPSLKIVF